MGARALPAGVVAALALAALPPTGAAARTVSSAVITVGRGVNGVELGMSRARVIRRLGRPNSENSFGTMSYGSDRANTIFDVYRTSGGASGKVKQFVIAAPRNRAFRLQDGNRVFTRGGLRRLAGRYGRRLTFHRFDDGTPYYELATRLHGRRVLTDFATERRALDSYVLDVFIVFG